MPVFSGSKMPRADMHDDEKARLCSVYFRPWTLCTDFEVTPHVPHLLHMTAYPEPAVRHRKRAKGKAAPEEAVASWASSWTRYIHGNVVSEHAARLIRRFLSLTLARRCGDNAHDSDDDAMSEKDNMEGNAAEAVKISLDDAHEILRFNADKEEEDAAGDEGSKGTSNRRKGPKRKQSHWSQQPNAGDGLWDTSGNMETNAIDEYKKAARSIGKESKNKATSRSLRAGVHLCACVTLRSHAQKISSHACSSMTHNSKTYTRRRGATISRRRGERVSTRTEASLTSTNGSKNCRLSFLLL